MTRSIRIPLRAEQELDRGDARKKVRKREAVKRALDGFLVTKRGAPSPYDLGSDLIGPHTDETPTEDVARNTKRLMGARKRR